MRVLTIALVLGSIGLTGCGSSRLATGVSRSGVGYEARLQQAIVGCMARAGFSYRSYQPPDPNSLSVLTAKRRRYGFFLFARYAGVSDPALDPAPSPSALSDPANPNGAVVRALSRRERTRYLSALYGAPSANGIRVAGCGEAAQIANAPTAVEIARWRTVQAHYHNAIARSLTAYASCLSARGYGVTANPQEIIQTVYGAEVRALDNARQKGPISRPAARRDMRQEIAASLVDLACGKTWYRLHDEEVNAMLGQPT